ncbi:predicted protein [Sclerotinia sclerotiorum 1980 UF-70]|uniref:Uncharacterized protein n=2 Tax=Sclerotinia sclerotiorum (strain ATCC 18683 / 1980 / Ss-1) TaxID=665079 RepID=A7ED44_SCLS1|nr:predicted protein [Sclerotinia sclerotiorum 1980 UF-70]APA11047.1 hypothetical protein sscle_07g058170 [Sclerotinia sclerotiorum 1980 UF-70]EDO00760.1 predicted protein [Sclerotinia sclerotiorum 1980 UF-70]
MSAKHSHRSDGQISHHGLPPFRSYSENVGLRVRPERHVRRKWNKEQLEYMERLRREKVERVGYGEDGVGKNYDRKDNKTRGWIKWEKWRFSIGFVLFNLVVALPLAYLVAKYAVFPPWQWITFILSHHAILAASYEKTMNIRDRIIREEEDKLELERWDEVVRKLEDALRDSRRGRLMLGRVENGLMGMWEGEGRERRLRREDEKEKENDEVAREAVDRKLEEMEYARRRGAVIDRELWVELKRKQVGFDRVAQYGRDEGINVDGRWRGRTWWELCEAEGVLGV